MTKQGAEDLFRTMTVGVGLGWISAQTQRPEFFPQLVGLVSALAGVWAAYWVIGLLGLRDDKE